MFRNQKPWPLERAELIQRHNKAVEQRVAEARRYGYEQAMEDIGKHYLDRHGVDAIYHAATIELGRRAGKHASSQIEKLNPVIREQQAILALCLRYVELSATARMTQDIAITTLNVEFRPCSFSYQLAHVVDETMVGKIDLST